MATNDSLTRRNPRQNTDLEHGNGLQSTSDVSEKPHNDPTGQNINVSANDPALRRRGTGNSSATSVSGAIAEEERERFMDRLRGKGKNIPGVGRSLYNVMIHSPVNILFLVLPVAWAVHFVFEQQHFHEHREDSELTFHAGTVFALNFVAIIPLEKTFDWLGEELGLYLGYEIGGLLEITLNNAVEAALAIILTVKGELRLMQATVIGVIILHLLLIPGVSFLTGGARIAEQHLHAHNTELNHSLLTVGVMTLILPAAFFAALDRGSLADLTEYVTKLNETHAEGGGEEVIHSVVNFGALLTDETRGHFLRFSRGLAIIMIIVYIASRIYLHDPPGDGNALSMHKTLHPEQQKRLKEESMRDPKVSLGVGVAVTIITVGIMAATAEWLVASIETLRVERGLINEWFGIILLPFLTFAADGLIAIVFFIRKLLRRGPPTPEDFTRGIAIDLSIQFLLLWLPFVVLLAWWVGQPLSLLFDLWEIAVVVAACFLVNYVTADAKTNWAEGWVLVAFYTMIALVSWYYPGQIEVADFLVNKSQTVADAVANGVAEHA